MDKKTTDKDIVDKVDDASVYAVGIKTKINIWIII